MMRGAELAQQGIRNGCTRRVRTRGRGSQFPVISLIVREDLERSRGYRSFCSDVTVTTRNSIGSLDFESDFLATGSSSTLLPVLVLRQTCSGETNSTVVSNVRTHQHAVEGGVRALQLSGGRFFSRDPPALWRGCTVNSTGPLASAARVHVLLSGLARIPRLCARRRQIRGSCRQSLQIVPPV